MNKNVEPAPRKATGSVLGEGWLVKAAFGVSLLGVVFAAGMAVAHFNTFPYTVLNEAKAALNAELQLEDDRLPSNIDGFEPAPKKPTIRRISSQAGDEKLLIVGNFYSRLDLCPRFGCLAWVMDRNGKVLHTWPSPDPAVFFKDIKGFTGRVKPNNFYVIGVAYGADGSIVTTFHGRNLYPYQVGMAKFDVDGRLLWKEFHNSHHWPAMGADGRIYVPYVKIGDRPGYLGGTETNLKCTWGKVYMEGVRIVGPDGVIQKEFSAADIIARGDYPGLAYGVRDGCDPFHVNGIDLVNAEGAKRLNVRGGALPTVEVGDLLVSLREASTMMIIDKDDGALKRTISGRTSAQHSPHFLADGRIIAFDNLGGQRKLGGSRVVVIDPATGLSKTIFPQGDEGSLLPFSSATSGVVNPSPDGKRILVSSSKQSRLIEIDTETGEPLWVYDNIMDFKPYLEGKGFKEKQTYGRLPTNGAFYIQGPSFLDRLKPGVAAGSAHKTPPAG